MVDVSIVIPCYRGAHIARRTVAVLVESLGLASVSGTVGGAGAGAAAGPGPGTWEILVVDDGGGDFDPAEWKDDSRITLLRLPANRGKGAAVRHGMLAATGAIRIFTDVDLPFGVASVHDVIRVIRETGVHVVIGDRTLPQSEYRVHLGWLRQAASLAFTAFVGTIVTGGFYDTQCGLKGLRGDAADALFRVLRIDRFAFDVELMYVAIRYKLRIERVPVRLLNNETSSVRLMRDATQGFIDVLRLRYHTLRGWYASNALEAVARQGNRTLPISVTS